MAERLTRRDLFGMFRKSLRGAAADELPLRPPGAIAEDLIADSCTRCGACIDFICPRRAIRAIPRGHAAGVGTPFIIPREAPCVMCSGLLCSTVCPSGTLRPFADPQQMRIGRAIINRSSCLPYRERSATPVTASVRCRARSKSMSAVAPASPMPAPAAAYASTTVRQSRRRSTSGPRACRDPGRALDRRAPRRCPRCCRPARAGAGGGRAAALAALWGARRAPGG